MDAPSRTSGAPKKKKFSNFLVTINSNYRPRDDTDARATAEELKSAAEKFFTLEPILECVSVRGPPGVSVADNIVRVEVVTWSIELGGNTRGQRLHVHAMLKFVHTTWLQLKPEAIKAWWVKELEDDVRIKNIYVNIRWVPATEELLKAYIEKQQSVGAVAAARTTPTVLMK